MSYTAKQLIYNIKNLRAGGVQSDDTKLSDRQILFIANYYRAKLIRQEYNKYKSIVPEEIQDLGKVSLIKTDPHEYECSTDQCILRSEFKIPKSLIATRNHGFTFVGMYGGMAWQETTWKEAGWMSFRKYTGGKTKWFIKGQYIYVINPIDPLLSYINIQGVFEDPHEAYDFRQNKCVDATGCDDPFDFQYPMPMHLIQPLTQLIIENEIRWSTLLPEDTTNDSKDDN